MIEYFFELFEQLIDSEYYRLLCLIIGTISIFTFLFFISIRFLIFIYRYFKALHFRWCGGSQMWAVVTGATDGIGKAYAKQLYGKDYNLLLISRNQQKLDIVKEDIHLKYGFKRKIRTLAIDFSQSSDDIYDRIETEFENLDEIHVLVNNVGTNYPNESPEYFTQIPNLNEVIMRIINVNIVSCTRMTALVLPRMEKRGRGIIVNLSSFSALFPAPLLALYSASKVYVDYMSRALQEEYRSKGIIIQSLLPYYVSTRMTHNMKTTFYAPTPDRYVSQAINTVGWRERTAGYLWHSLWGWFYWGLGVLSTIIGIDFNIKLAFLRLKEVRNRIHSKEDPKREIDIQEHVV